MLCAAAMVSLFNPPQSGVNDAPTGENGRRSLPHFAVFIDNKEEGMMVR